MLDKQTGTDRDRQGQTDREPQDSTKCASKQAALVGTNPILQAGKGKKKEGKNRGKKGQRLEMKKYKKKE